MSKNLVDNNSPSQTVSTSLCKYNGSSGNHELELCHRFKLDTPCSGVRSVNVTTDNQYLIITNTDSAKMRVFDLEKLEFLPHKFGGHTSSVRLTSIASNNKEFFTASWDGTYRRFDLNSGKCKQKLIGLSRSPSCFIDPEMRYLFTASYDYEFDPSSKNNGRCWDLSSGKVISLYKHEFYRKNPEAIDIAFDGEYVYTGSDDGHGIAWNMEGRLLINYFQFDGVIRKVAVSNEYFACACSDGIIRIHDKKTGKYYKYITHSQKEVKDVRFSNDETKIYSASDDGTVKCFDLLEGKLLFSSSVHSSWIWSICLFNNGKLLVTGSIDGSVAFLSAQTGQILARLLNLPWDNELLITVPPDNVFPNGFFYTTNRDFIQVIEKDNDKQVHKILDKNDPRRILHLNKLNLKNLLKSRLHQNEHYKLLTEQYLKHQNILKGANTLKFQRALKEGIS